MNGTHSSGRQQSTAASRVLICHPERQHAHELARALHEMGWLGSGDFIYGAPLPDSALAAIPARLRRRMRSSQLTRAVLRRTLPTQLAIEYFYRALWLFDFRVSRIIGRGKYSAVICYENSALHSFRAAKKVGVKCILDHASVHHSLQDRMVPAQVGNAMHRRIRARKDEELALADTVLTCSKFAADSFRRAGIPSFKIKTVSLGCASPLGGPRVHAAKPPSAPLRFLFVGHPTRAKGLDLLAVAVERLRSSGLQFQLVIAGDPTVGDRELLGELQASAQIVGKVAHEKLGAYYAEADCLVFPSRFDSFGLVVGEALASGVPAIVTSNVGASDLIVDGRNGWVVPAGELDALVERMAWCALNPTQLREMRADTAALARQWTWAQYRSRVAEVLADVLAGC